MSNAREAMIHKGKSDYSLCKRHESWSCRFERFNIMNCVMACEKAKNSRCRDAYFAELSDSPQKQWKVYATSSQANPSESGGDRSYSRQWEAVDSHMG